MVRKRLWELSMRRRHELKPLLTALHVKYLGSQVKSSLNYECKLHQGAAQPQCPQLGTRNAYSGTALLNYYTNTIQYVFS